MSTTPTLKKALNQRQLTMIAIGGVIGAGLFVGSGVVIGDTGPGTFITYALAGVLIIMVIRMLAEMAVANPSTGSFADYSRNALGNWAGFSVGWLYWYFWVIVVGFEAIAGAKIIQYWIEIPLWLTALVLMILMTATNLFSVSSFGEFEFWFAGIKVAAIIVFIALGSLFVLGLWPNKSMDFSNLWAHGGFMPLGFMAITVGIVTVIFSMVGAEIATIAAAESEDPERAVTKAANSVIVRIAIFFVGSIFLLATILPWNDETLAASPFVTAFTKMGIPYADHIMNAVVLTAVLSCLNSGMYTASRMLFVLAARREAPPQLVVVTRRGVPATAILASSVVGFLCVIAAGDLAGHDLRVPAQLQRRDHPVRLPADRHLADRAAVPHPGLPAKGEDVAVPGVVNPDRRGDSGDPGADGPAGGHPVTAHPEPVVVGSGPLLYFAEQGVPESAAQKQPGVAPSEKPHRVLVMANETANSEELLDELRRIGADSAATYFVVVPASPIETGVAATHGPLDSMEATQQAAQARLDHTLSTLRSDNLEADGALGDQRPLRALAEAVDSFHPDQIVIATLPPEDSVWHRFDVVDRARAEHGVPVTHVVATPAGAESTR